jgi:hypothetical protein
VSHRLQVAEGRLSNSCLHTGLGLPSNLSEPGAPTAEGRVAQRHTKGAASKRSDLNDMAAYMRP